MKFNKKFTLIFFVCLLTLSIGGCTIFNRTTNEITNKVTNEITQKVIDYNGEFSVEDLENAVQIATKRVESAVVGVTLKKVTTSKINGVNYEFEDPESIGSGVIYKRIDNKDQYGNITSYSYYMYTNAHVVLSDNEGEHVIYAYLGEYDVEISAKLLVMMKKLIWLA